MRPSFVALLGLAVLSSACSIRKSALRSVADSLSSSGEGGAFARDDDPELVRDALPFALKTMEGLADQLDDHSGLREGLARGFTTYGYAFVQQPAELGGTLEQQKSALTRARKLYLRARDYGLEGLRIRRGIAFEDLRGVEQRRGAALAKLETEDVGLVYWTLAAWGAAIATNKNDLDLVGDVPVLAALLDRALQLDESYDHGALHEFALAFDPARPGGTTRELQQRHFQRALELSRGLRISPWVAWADAVLAPAQDKRAYVEALKKAADFDVEDPKARNDRLANVLAQRRARYQLSHLDDVFSD